MLFASHGQIFTSCITLGAHVVIFHRSYMGHGLKLYRRMRERPWAVCSKSHGQYVRKTMCVIFRQKDGRKIFAAAG